MKSHLKFSSVISKDSFKLRSSELLDACRQFGNEREFLAIKTMARNSLSFPKSLLDRSKVEISQEILSLDFAKLWGLLRIYELSRFA